MGFLFVLIGVLIGIGLSKPKRLYSGYKPVSYTKYTTTKLFPPSGGSNVMKKKY